MRTSTSDAGFYIQFAPKSGNVRGLATYKFKLTIQNYGEGRNIMVTASGDEGIDVNFPAYTTFMEKDATEDVLVSVTPLSDAKTSYKIRASATSGGSSRIAEAWLNVDEMVSDMNILGEDDLEDVVDDIQFTSIDDWETIDAETGGTGNVIRYDGEEGGETPEVNYTLYIMIAGIIAAVVLLGFYTYKKMQTSSGQSSGPSWEDLGA